MKQATTLISLILCSALLVACNDPEPKSKLTLVGEGEATLPAFILPDMGGQSRSQKEWDGQVIVVNFWATWCPPCLDEMPRFVKLQEQFGSKGVTIVAIAIDSPAEVQDFADVYELNFPVLIGGVNAIKLSNRMGNRFESLPFTAIYDRQGKAQFAQAGEVSMEQLLKTVKPLL